MKIAAIEHLQISDEAVEELAKKFFPSHEFSYYKERPASQAELASRLSDVEVAIGVNFPIGREALSEAKKLKMISVSFTGYDHVDLQAATNQGVVVSNVPHYATQSVTELVYGLIFMHLRNLIKADHVVRTGWTREGLLGEDLYGKTLGIIGLGAIGQSVAKVGVAFGARVLAYDVMPRDEIAKQIGIELTDMETLLKMSDIVTIHVPLLSSTRGLIGEREIGLMKDGAILINAARGPIVVKEALCRALAEGKIRAGIDVYDVEPLPLNDPILSVKNTVLTPHIGFYTKEALIRRNQIAFENVKSFIEGKPQNVVNPEVLK